MGALDKIQRGFDTSGRPLYGTRQAFQFYDRVNDEAAGGLLVIVQGSWSFASTSANTHSQAMCMDFRSWNLPGPVLDKVVRHGRDLMGTMWFRTAADGVGDPHIHNNLIGDSPADPAAVDQVNQYRLGLNGLANRNIDRNPYRPEKIHNYVYLEDDMAGEGPEILRRVTAMQEDLKQFKNAEWKRDQEEKKRFSDAIAILGGNVDTLQRIEDMVKDSATKSEVRRERQRIMRWLKDNPDVTQQDNPSDEAMAAVEGG